MNRHAMIKAKFAAPLLLPLTLLISACDGGASEAPAEEPPLAGADIGGPFTLTDSEGNKVSWSDFDGKYRIVYFGYTYCPDVCPADVNRIALGYNRFKKANPEMAAQVQPIFITVDPARDTPAKVGEFTHAFSDDMIGLTGTPEEIRKAADEFKVWYELGEPNAEGGYLVNHTNITYLMGRKGEPLAALPVDEGPEAVAADLEKWIG